MAGNRETIEDKVAALGNLPREDLVALWRKTLGAAPPKGVHRELLIRAAAFHLQQKHLGGLSGEAKRLLKTAMRDTAKVMAERKRARDMVGVVGVDCAATAAVSDPPTVVSASAPVERRTILPGARLIREWNGNSHVVDVVDEGFLYAGSRYRSLSKIAREITGTNWSGPRFFGL